MYESGGFRSCVALLIVVAQCGVNGKDITEPGRQTHIYGDDFLVVVPLDEGEPDTGSLLQIACMDCGDSLEASGNITLLGTDFMVNFTAGPTTSVSLDEFSPFWTNQTVANQTVANQTVANLVISSDLNITVTIILKIGGTLNAYTAIPSKSLDKYYPVVSYGNLKKELSELIAVAIKNKTNITFKPFAKNLKPKSCANTCAKNRGEWKRFQTNGSFYGDKLEGDKPIIGIVGTRCQSRNQICPRSLEQLYPLVSLGTKYVAVPVIHDDLKNVFRAVAVWNNTILMWFSGKKTLNHGEVQDITPDVGQTGTIEGSKPFILLHHTELGTPSVDNAVATIPPMEQFTRKTFTFSTYQAEDITIYISIMAPCKDINNTMLPEKPSAGEPESRKTTANEGTFSSSKLCGKIRTLSPGTYTIGPSPQSPQAKYSAVLYGITDQGNFAHILASELYQVTCSVKPIQQVTLCPEFIPIEPIHTTPTPQGQTTVTEDNHTPTKGTPAPSSSNGTVIGVVVAVASLLIGLVIMGICMIRYYRGHTWSRLFESQYSEENPLRMEPLDNTSSTI